MTKKVSFNFKCFIDNILYKEFLIYPLYIIVLSVLTIYSYALIDLNLTLINHSFWENFRSYIIQLGYFKRNLSVNIYLVLVICLFLLNYLVVRSKISPLRIALVIGIITLFSYPFLSHDFFNYMFYGKILAFYHKNPYLYRPFDFSHDPWLRFMHWTHVTYPYGPVFLVIVTISSFLSFGKFILGLFFLKFIFFVFYLISIYLASKIERKWALMMATSPLIIIEGLVSSHNDLIALTLGVIGIYYLFKQRAILARLMFIFSAGIKYITLPLIFLTRFNKKINYLVFAGLISILFYLSIKSEIQPWYFLAVFILFPFLKKTFFHLNIFFAGLLFSYYPYIRFGGWDKVYKVQFKHNIIIFFLVANIFFSLAIYCYKLKKSS